MIGLWEVRLWGGVDVYNDYDEDSIIDKGDEGDDDDNDDGYIDKVK